MHDVRVGGRELADSESRREETILRRVRSKSVECAVSTCGVRRAPNAKA